MEAGFRRRRLLKIKADKYDQEVRHGHEAEVHVK